MGNYAQKKDPPGTWGPQLGIPLRFPSDSEDSTSKGFVVFSPCLVVLKIFGQIFTNNFLETQIDKHMYPN